MWPRSYRYRKLLRTSVLPGLRRPLERGLFPGGGSAIVETVCDTNETEAATQTRDRCSRGNPGTGQAFDFTRSPDPGHKVLRLWRRNHFGLQRTALLGLPPPEDQCLARDRAADARSG